VIAPRRVLVTGAAGAIGAAIARAMRTAWPETRLALLDRDAAAMAGLAHDLGAATTHGADLRDVDALPALVRALDPPDPPDRPDPIDGLVNCAGVMRVRRVSTWAWDDARDLLAVDLLAPLRLQALLVPGMVERGGGVIVNVASMAGKTPLKGCAYYGAAKAGLGMASEIAHAELAPHGVRVVTVYPGPVRSALEAGARADYGGGGWFARLAPVGDPAELARRVLAAIAQGEPRVVYPRVYEFGRIAPNLASWIALTLGPPPVA
jgi:short-subunit dehydrogenase